MNKIKRILIVLGAVAMMALSATSAFADPPQAGGSGHFKGSAQPCQGGGGNPNCPPFGG